MKNLSKELILTTAAALVEETNSNKISLTDVGQTLGVSHAALYKYFPNKKSLWTALALKWLNDQLSRLFPFDTTGYSSTQTIAHDWLWVLAETKYQAKKNDPQMFALYTTYIGQEEEIYDKHTQELGESFMAATELDEETTVGLLYAFISFSAPDFSHHWDDHFQENFERVWQVVKGSIE